MDRLESVLLPSHHLVIAAAASTATCRDAQRAHGLTPLPAVALGRLLTATALAAAVQQRPGTLSIQLLGHGQLGQLLADVTESFELRGYVRNPQLTLPLLPGERHDMRRALAHAVGEGAVSVIRTPTTQDFSQSATPLVTGEIDTDVEDFLAQSDQIPTALACDVLLDEHGAVARAGGVIVQGMPGADLSRLKELRARIAAGALVPLLAEYEDAAALLRVLAPEARSLGEGRALAWRCRCSHERALSAVPMLGAAELADMVQQGEPAFVRCDFCGTNYEVSPAEIAAVYERTVTERS